MSLASSEDVSLLSGLFFASPSFMLTVEGRLPQFADAEMALSELPPGTNMDDKLFGGYWLGDQLVGCMDLIRSYPKPDIAYLGLLLFREDYQGKGLGVQALHQILDIVRSWDCSRLRLAVIDKNFRALQFWQREAFREIHRQPTLQYAGDAIVMERII